jgi:WD40 repeat protein
VIEAPARVVDLRFAPSPYKGLIPYSEDDYAFFFGREREQQVITANLLASRMTLLYGPSGVGKSSVLRAGVVHRLRERSKRNLANEDRGSPQFIVVEFSSWRDDPLGGLAASIEQSVRLVMGDRTPPPPAPHARSLRAIVTSWTEQLKATLLIILDQFEEYFLYHGREEGDGTFDSELPSLFDQPTVAANFLISIREDAYTLLDRFEGRIPHLFDNNLRVDHLSRKDARSAIEKPIDRYNELTAPAGAAPYSIEPALVDTVLEEVKAGQVEASHPGSGVEIEDDDRVEAPYLQLVMSRLWDQEAQLGSRTLRLSTLQQLGGAKEIVRTHLDDAMATLSPEERVAAAKALRFLVTPSGSKVALSVDALADFTQVPEPELAPLLEKLSGSGLRILRPVDPPPGEPQVSRYEIFHDVLGAAIRDWRARFEARAREADQVRELEDQKHQAEQRARQARKRLIRVSAVALVAVMFAVASLLVGVWAVHQKNVASEQRSKAQEAARVAREQTDTALSESMVAQALAHLESNPQTSVRLALGAIESKDTPDAEAVLREALSDARVRAVMAGHTGTVWTAAFSNDATRVVTSSEDKTAMVWDAQTGKRIAVLGGSDAVIWYAAFSPSDPNVVLTLTNYPDDVATLWDVASQTPRVLQVPGDKVYTAAFSPDGRFVATGEESGDVWIWDVTTGQRVGTPFASPGYAVTAVAYTPDGKLLATGSDDYGVRVWDVEGRSVLGLWYMTSRPVAIAFSPVKHLVSAGGYDGKLILWNWKTDRLVGPQYDLYRGTIKSTSFSSDGRYVLAAADKVVDVFDGSTGVFINRMEGKGNWVDYAEFSPDGNRVAAAYQDGTARVYEAQTGGQLFVLHGHTDIVWSARFSPDGTRVVTASEDGLARVWDVSIGQEYRGHTYGVGALFSPDGTVVATYSKDWTARLWDAASGTLLHELKGHTAPIWSAAFSRDGGTLATASGDGDVRLWNVHTGAEGTGSPCCQRPDATDTVVDHVDVGVDANHLLVVYDDQTAWVWDLVAGTSTQIGGPNLTDVLSGVFSPDGALVATADRTTKSVRIWDAATGIEQGEPLVGSRGLINSVVWSGTSIVTSSTDGVVRLWDAEERRVIRAFRASSTSVIGADISADGKQIASAGGDGAVTVWARDTGAVLGIFHPNGSYLNSIDFSPDGTKLLTGSDDLTAKLFSCSTCGAMEQVEAAACAQLKVEGIPNDLREFCRSLGST